MSNNIIVDEIKEFLKQANLTNYEIRAYLALLTARKLTARELSKKSRVPMGRIYEVLEELKEKGLVEILGARPKVYSIISPNKAFNDLINHLAEENKRKNTILIDQARILENKISRTSLISQEEGTSRVFWSTAFGTEEAFSLYTKKFNELEKELLMTGFINENTIKILPFAKPFYHGIIKAFNRGVQVKYLWSFEHDIRQLTETEKQNNLDIYMKLVDKMNELYGISSNLSGFEMRFIHKKVPTYFDIFDGKRILIKLQNPLEPSRIFACINVLDPKLASALREKFNTLWMIDARKETD